MIEHLISDIRTFLLDCRSRKLSPKTVTFYELELEYLHRYLTSVQVSSVDQISSNHLRGYLDQLGEHRNPGGVHAAFRSIKVFTRWWGKEYAQAGWVNPVSKLSPPKVNTDPRPGVPVADVQAMIDSCKRGDERDRAILLALLDTGLRRAEFVALNIGDVDLDSGTVQVRHGKGGKARVVFLGLRARRELSRYLRNRELLPSAPLWLSNKLTRLTAMGLRQVIRRRALLVGVPVPGLHDFRRLFAVSMLRNGCDTFTLMRLMGHTSPVVLNRYLKLVDADLRQVHARVSPGDNL